MNKTEKMMALAVSMGEMIREDFFSSEVGDSFNVSAQIKFALDEDELEDLEYAINEAICDFDEKDVEFYGTPEDPFCEWIKKCAYVKLNKIEAHSEDGSDGITEIVVDCKVINEFFTGGLDLVEISEEDFYEILCSTCCTGPYSFWSEIDELDEDEELDEDDEDDWSDED